MVRLTSLGIENFRSIDREIIYFAPLTALIGANASGKSNILDALAFLQDAVTSDVETAIEKRGGINEVRCKRVRRRKINRPITFNARIESFSGEDSKDVRDTAARMPVLHRWNYHLEIAYKLTSEETVIQLERLECDWSSSRTPATDPERTVLLQRDSKRVVWQRLPMPYLSANASEEQELDEEHQNRTMLAFPRYGFGAAEVLRFIRGFSFFSIDPEVAREPSRISPRAYLGERGEGLASVLRNLLRGRRQRTAAESLSEMMRAAVPNFDSIRVVRSAGGRCVFEVREKGLRTFIGPEGLSDGTIKLLCYFLLSFYTGNRETVVAIEEPENGLHPHLVPMLTEHLASIAESKQVIITSHDPRLVSELQPENVIMVDRVNSTTRVRRASDIADLEIFLRRFRLGDLWVQGELGGEIGK